MTNGNGHTSIYRFVEKVGFPAALVGLLLYGISIYADRLVQAMWALNSEQWKVVGTQAEIVVQGKEHTSILSRPTQLLERQVELIEQHHGELEDHRKSTEGRR